MLENVGYRIKDFFAEHTNNIQMFWIIWTIFGIWIQLFFLIRLHAIQFFSWSQTINDFVIIFWYFVVMFVLFYLIHKIFKGKFFYKYIILIFIIILLVLHFFGKINHYIDSYFVIFFSVLAFFLFFGDIISLVQDIFHTIKENTFKKSTFIIQIISLLSLIVLYGYIYIFFFRNVDNTFFDIYKVDFQYKWVAYKSVYFNDKYIFAPVMTGTSWTPKTMIFPVSMVDFFSK